MKHIRYEHKDCDRPGYCPYCDGGLFTCTVCGGNEGELPTECPGRKMTQEERDAVMAGTLNYRNGEWRQEPN